jgi:hypothetical protein
MEAGREEGTFFVHERIVGQYNWGMGDGDLGTIWVSRKGEREEEEGGKRREEEKGGGWNRRGRDKG